MKMDFQTEPASSNPSDEYLGEEIIKWTRDLRGMAMNQVSDWLQLMDPERAETASARYKNKESRTTGFNQFREKLR